MKLHVRKSTSMDKIDTVSLVHLATRISFHEAPSSSLSSTGWGLVHSTWGCDYFKCYVATVAPFSEIVGGATCRLTAFIISVIPHIFARLCFFFSRCRILCN